MGQRQDTGVEILAAVGILIRRGKQGLKAVGSQDARTGKEPI